MRITEMYYIAVILLVTIGGLLIWDSLFSKNIIKSKVTLKSLKGQLIEAFSDKTYDDVFFKAGIKLSIRKYTAYRNLIEVLMLLIIIYKFSTHQNDVAFKIALLAGVFLVITSPKKELIKGKKSPFQMVLDGIYKKRQQALDNELVSIMSQMRGMIVSNGSNISADYIFTRILPYTRVSKSIFIQIHSFLMLGRREEAARFFADSYGTILGKKFSNIILKIDTLPLAEFLKEIEILQKTVQDEKRTLAERRRQTKINIIFLSASVQVALLVFDLIYIVQMDAVNMLKTL